MAQIYIIVATYGQWDCYQEDNLFATTDEQLARSKAVELADQFAGVFAQMVENFIHINDFGDVEGDESVINVARRAYHDDGLTLVLRSMEMDCINPGFQDIVPRYEIPFLPDDHVSLNDEPHVYDSKYERMAFPYEQIFHGVKH